MIGKKGFTLIELMLVVVILGTLAAVIVPRYSGYALKAKIARAKSDIVGITGGLAKFELENGRYPSTADGLKALMEKPSWAPEWDGPYLTRPSLSDPWGKQYEYQCPAERGVDYDLYSCGPDREKGNDDDIGNWQP